MGRDPREIGWETVFDVYIESVLTVFPMCQRHVDDLLLMEEEEEREEVRVLIVRRKEELKR